MILVSKGPQHKEIKFDSYDWSLSKVKLGYLYLEFGQKWCAIAWPIHVKAPFSPFMGLNIQRVKAPIYKIDDIVSIQPMTMPKSSLFYLGYKYDSSLPDTPS